MAPKQQERNVDASVSANKYPLKESNQNVPESEGFFNFTYSEYVKHNEGMRNWLWARVYLHHVFSKVVEYERPYHYRFQKLCRSPMLDAFMQRLTLVGSTASFIIIVPLMFLVGDLLCLSRPAFPVERIDLVLKHSQEFGFPSCHTFLAVALGRVTMSYFFRSRNIGL
ncbi:Long-chain base-1-phosphate phosphatase [Entomophthora muscae]|uniref:Long-chain base-1-phosphate phosphatase n=1 Tax=Entomophthora muscae TaxID=34485 RepID=A0ACC2TET9_9FUNG|nr:Long-chain base-1-phosphate phosphatase [Entomophthora muscae]